MLRNICYDEGQVAQCNNITSKRGTKTTPMPLVMKQFDFNLVDDAKINNVVIKYADRVVSYDGDFYPEISAPTITVTSDGFSCTVKGEAPSSNFTTHEVRLPQYLTVEQLNSNNLTVKISYPANTGEYGGALYVNYVELDVDYDKPKYNVSFTEPRHHNGGDITWSTWYDPSNFPLYSHQRIKSNFRTYNGVNLTEQEILYYIPKCFKVTNVQCERGTYEWIDDTHLVWRVVAPNTIGSDGLYDLTNIVFDVFTVAVTNREKCTAKHYQCSATYYANIYNQFDFLKRENDLTLYHRNFERYNEDTLFNCVVDIDSIPIETLKKMDCIINLDTKIWSVDKGEYINQETRFVCDEHATIVQQDYENKMNSTYVKVPLTNHIMFQIDGYFTDDYGTRFVYPEGDYEFHIALFYEEGASEPVLFKFPFSVTPAPVYVFELQHSNLVVNTPNIATQTGSGGCTFLCQTQEGFGRWNSNMSGFNSFIENRYKHIGALRIGNSHHDPKYSFKNPVKEGSWKERKYYSKSGNWEESLSLNIYLPFLQWKTLEGFVKMDKPVAIEMCPRCSDDDVLNHRGWVELESINNVERVNPWVYKGEIGVKYLTKKYWARAKILKGNRITNSPVPYSLLNVLDKGDYFLDWFDLLGAGQITYDLDKNIVNEINCGTGESLHFRNKWVLKDINDYTFCWTSTLPSEATDESNDYKYNSITYSILDARTNDVLLQYTLYDFTTFDEDGNVVNTCNANCTVFRQGESFNVFNRKVKLDWEEGNPTTYGSNTRFEFNTNYVTLTESGANGSEIYEQNIQLDSAEYLIDVSFDNNDVGLLEPNFTSHLDVIAYENAMSNSFSNFYEDMFVSPFPLTGNSLLFYRKSEEGILYYYAGDGKGEFVINGFEQYKCGVDLQTSSGVSIVYVDNYTGTLYLNNNLIKVGFDRMFGTVSFYIYDAKEDKFIYTNSVKIEDFDVFEIVELNDDKAQIQFGETIWTMWRGHPYIQCEHINVDLRLTMDFDTVNCESLMTPSGKVLYDGKYGKSEVNLNSIVTTTHLDVTGENAPSFISGEPIRAVATVTDNYGEFIGEDIGKMEFIVNGESVYVDPNPTIRDGVAEWVYDFVPPIGDDDYRMVAHLLPDKDYFESESMPFYYGVNRLETYILVNVNDDSDPVVNVPLGEPVVLDIDVLDMGSDKIDGVRVTSFDLKSNHRIAQGITADGIELNVPSNRIENQGIYQYLIVADSTDTYSECEDYSSYVRIYDTAKTPVDDNAISWQREGKKLVFTNDLPNNATVKLNNDTFTLDETYEYPLKGAGEYDIIIMYDGDDDNQSYIRMDNFSLEQTPIEILIEFSDEYPAIVNYGSLININGYVFDSPPINVTLYDNGVPVASSKADDTFSFQHIIDTVGNHALQVKYGGDSFTASAESNVLNIVIGQNATELRRCNGDLYRFTTDMFQLTDSLGNPLANKEIKYKVNGVTYSRVTDELGCAIMLIQLYSGSYPVHIEFFGDDINTPCTLDYTLLVKEPVIKWKVPQNMVGVNGKTPPYQKWTGRNFDGLNGSTYLVCGNGMTNTELITGKDGTYPQPDDLRLNNFGFNIPSNAKITSINVRWYERQYNPRNTANFPRIGEGSAVLENLDKDLGRLMGSEIPLQASRGFNSVKVSWNTVNNSVLASKINSSAFGVLFKHEPNTSSNVGSLMLKYLEVGVGYVVEPERDILGGE